MEAENVFIKPEVAYAAIRKDLLAWDAKIKPAKYVVGISGGVDSSCVAALAAKLFGKDMVIGVTMPNGIQRDIDCSMKLIKHLGIKHVDINIAIAVNDLQVSIDKNGLTLSELCITNMPARIRMTALFGVAQCCNGIVLNTCNRSESVVGYDTLFGDSCGSYAPVKWLVKTEVRELAKWLGVPEDLAYKTSVDGLQPLTDEEKFGFTYEALDKYIRCGKLADVATAAKIESMYMSNKFKLQIINVPGPQFKFAYDKLLAEHGI